jgi:2-keto-myo-inositol isomerase
VGVTPDFALNHMCAPGLRVEAFFDLAASLGVGTVEVRNDLVGQAILDGTPPDAVREAAEIRDLRIASINALQRFNDWTDERADEARGLVDYAAACGAQAVVLVPVNDGSGRANGERQANLRVALKSLAPILGDAGLIGLVEPLGFAECSLRLKSEAVEAIQSTGTSGTFRLVHDTFHHHLAGEADRFADMTGLVHISGVSDQGLAVLDMRDAHRVLIDPRDRLGNLEQLDALLSDGYRGPLSFEPFAASVHGHADIAGAIRASMAHIAAGLA